jgi:DNA replication protein DnaC
MRTADQRLRNQLVAREFHVTRQGRAPEQAAVIVTANLPFSEWITMFPNAWLCKAMIDRLTDQAHIIETGTESYGFRRTLARQKRVEGE